MCADEMLCAVGICSFVSLIMLIHSSSYVNKICSKAENLLLIILPNQRKHWSVLRF